MAYWPEKLLGMALTDLAAGYGQGNFGKALLIPLNAVENTLAIFVKPAAFGWISFASPCAD